MECTGNPLFDDHEPDVFAKQLERVLMVGQKEKIFQYTNANLYFIASYDDETMRFEPVQDPVLLLDCNLILQKRGIKEEFVKEAQEIIEEQKKKHEEEKKNG